MNFRSKYHIITSTIIIIICGSVLFLNFLSHTQVFKTYSKQFSETIIDLKKDFIKDTINNVFLEIDNLRALRKTTYDEYTESRLSRFQAKQDLPETEFAKHFINRFIEDTSLEIWTVLFWNTKTNQVLYSDFDDGSHFTFSKAPTDAQIDDIKSTLISCATFEKGNLRALFGISTACLDNVVKKEVAKLIRSRKFSNDSYIWINEIINYDGGDNYAIRFVHPNFPETEGSYLSTSMEDISGNLPYLEELEGIKKNGELFFIYDFKKLNSNTINKKITYAKLYKDYNWVIAMGLHLDDIDAQVTVAYEQFKDMTRVQIIKMLIYTLLVLVTGFIILLFMEKRNLKNATKSLEKEVNLDTLTNAGSRKYGEHKLQKIFYQYKSIGNNSALMLFDIDNFKSINDTFGHNTGDEILIQFVSTVKSLIRSSDYLFRWGGDEFLGVFHNMKYEYVPTFCQDILKKIEEIEIATEKDIVKTTASIGVTYFEPTDSSWKDAIKRVDKALYRAKGKGKNQASF